MNMTLGITTAEMKNSPETSSGGLIAAICQADKLNRKAYAPINFTGTINLVVQEYFRNDPVGQHAVLSILSSSLYNTTTGDSISSTGIDNLAGMIGSMSSGKNRINTEASAGFSIPYINPGTLNQISPSDRYAIVSKEEQRTFFSIRDTFEYSDLNVLLNLMQAYNWTIGANIFESNAFGFTMQQQVQSYASLNSVPIFTCNTIIAEDDFINPLFYINYCQCMSNINKLNLLALWMSPIVAYEFIISLKKKCKAAEDFIFIVTSESEPLPPKIYYDDTSFKSVFIIRPFGNLNFSAFLSDCLDTASSEAAGSVEILKQELLLNKYSCLEQSDNIELQECTGDILNRTELCLCTGSELDSQYNPYTVKLPEILIFIIV